MAIITAAIIILLKLVSAYVPVSNDMKLLYRLADLRIPTAFIMWCFA